MNRKGRQHRPLPTKLPITPFLASVSATSTVHVFKLPGQDFLVCYCFKINSLAGGFISQSEGMPYYRQASKDFFVFKKFCAGWLAAALGRIDLFSPVDLLVYVRLQ